ncbi:hypothetical protein HDU96_006930 [Phlyctochytrium bullatum]|nr:hypothetical protein HDU96_006930 [Phlyctochytrium bullatum]
MAGAALKVHPEEPSRPQRGLRKDAAPPSLDGLPVFPDEEKTVSDLQTPVIKISIDPPPAEAGPHPPAVPVSPFNLAAKLRKFLVEAEGWDKEPFRSRLSRLNLFSLNFTDPDEERTYRYEINRAEQRIAVVAIAISLVSIGLIVGTHWVRGDLEDKEIYLKCLYVQSISAALCVLYIIIVPNLPIHIIEKYLHLLTVSLYMVGGMLLVLHNGRGSGADASGAVSNDLGVVPAGTLFCHRQKEVTMRQCYIIASMISSKIGVYQTTLMSAKIETLYYMTYPMQNDTGWFHRCIRPVRGIWLKLFTTFSSDIETAFLRDHYGSYRKILRISSACYILPLIALPYIDVALFCSGYPQNGGAPSICSAAALQTMHIMRVAGYPGAFALMFLLSFTPRIPPHLSQLLVGLSGGLVVSMMLYVVTYCLNFPRAEPAEVELARSYMVDMARGLGFERIADDDGAGWQFLSYAFSAMFAMATGLRIRVVVFGWMAVGVMGLHPLIVRILRPAFRVGLSTMFSFLVLCVAAFVMGRSVDQSFRRLYLLRKMYEQCRGGERTVADVTQVTTQLEKEMDEERAPS